MAPENLIGNAADELLTVSEVAAVLKVPLSWVYDRTRRRGYERIPHIKLGKYLRFRSADIREWVQHFGAN